MAEFSTTSCNITYADWQHRKLPDSTDIVRDAFENCYTSAAIQDAYLGIEIWTFQKQEIAKPSKIRQDSFDAEKKRKLYILVISSYF